jgi:hypothetical protein
MGIYIYRVHGKIVKLEDGRKAHIVDFAYKPFSGFRGGDGINNKLHFESGCTASERMTLKADLLISYDEATGRGNLWGNPTGLKVFYDTGLGGERLPNLGDVQLTDAKGGKTFKIVKAREPVTTEGF